jgi:hypothetical protein
MFGRSQSALKLSLTPAIGGLAQAFDLAGAPTPNVYYGKQIKTIERVGQPPFELSL